jgi:CheY-like chemotaxis protein
VTARPRPQVLVVEDEWIIAEQMESALIGAGYEVVGPVGRVEAAMAMLLQGHHLDAAVLDVNVHGQRSFGLAEQLAKDAIPFVFVTGYIETNLPAALRKRPLMQKPVDLPRLCQRLEALLQASH